MGFYFAIGHCPKCRDTSLFQCRHPHHLLHLALALATSGLWLPVWFLLLLKSRRCVCGRCGQASSRKILITSPIKTRVSPAISGLTLPTGPIRSRMEFHSYLVRNNLVYYMPTSR